MAILQDDIKIKLLPDTFVTINDDKLLFVKLDNYDQIYVVEGLEKELYLEIDKVKSLSEAVEVVANKNSYNPDLLKDFAVKLVQNLKSFSLLNIEAC